MSWHTPHASLLDEKCCSHLLACACVLGLTDGEYTAVTASMYFAGAPSDYSLMRVSEELWCHIGDSGVLMWAWLGFISASSFSASIQTQWPDSRSFPTKCNKRTGLKSFVQIGRAAFRLFQRFVLPFLQQASALCVRSLPMRY